MPFCTKCGKPYQPAAKFCTGCGATLGQAAPKAAPKAAPFSKPLPTPTPAASSTGNNLEAKVKTLESQIRTLEGKLATAESRAKSAEAEVSRLKSSQLQSDGVSQQLTKANQEIETLRRQLANANASSSPAPSINGTSGLESKLRAAEERAAKAESDLQVAQNKIKDLQSAPPSAPAPPGAGAAGAPPPPPPPAGGAAPPPPPPPSGGAVRKAAPKPSAGRGALLAGINGFNKGALKRAKTVDKSGPAVGGGSGGGSGGSGSSSARGYGGGDTIAHQAMAALKGLRSVKSGGGGGGGGGGAVKPSTTQSAPVSFGARLKSPRAGGRGRGVPAPAAASKPSWVR